MGADKEGTSAKNGQPDSNESTLGVGECKAWVGLRDHSWLGGGPFTFSPVGPAMHLGWRPSWHLPRHE